MILPKITFVRDVVVDSSDYPNGVESFRKFNRGDEIYGHLYEIRWAKNAQNTYGICSKEQCNIRLHDNSILWQLKKSSIIIEGINHYEL